MSASFLACAIGLLKRRRYGVIAFLVAYVPFGLINASGKHTLVEQQQSGLLFIYIIITAIYLFKRWKLMGALVDNLEALRIDKATSSN